VESVDGKASVCPNAAPYIAVLLHLVFALLASAHVVLSKRDTRGAIGWVGVIWLAPLFGLLLYVWLGINRIERRASSLHTERPRLGSLSGCSPYPTEALDQALTSAGTHLKHLIALVGEVSRRPLLTTVH
jgi:cardiolipin synthase A/B